MGNLTNNPTVAQAFNRFGLGGRPDDEVPANAVDWLTAQITCADPAPTANMPTLQQNLTLLYEAEFAHPGSARQVDLAAKFNAMFTAEMQSFITYATTTTVPFRERLVWFWSNHFAIMATVPSVRPHMTGTIAQMLEAAILHPAMYIGLDAETSFGPQSIQAIAAANSSEYLSINENLGRETLELYSLGVNAGYTQADVDALAYLMTGINQNCKLGTKLGYFWDPSKAQPGSVTLLGKTYPCTQAGLSSALHMLGTSPKTYLHLATKLVTHFVSDTPQQSDIETVYNAFATSGGSLPAAHAAIVGLQNAWIPLQKLRTPLDLVVAMFRASNFSAKQISNLGCSVNGILTALSQPLWQPQFPNGYSDYSADWMGPGPMLLRADFANWFAADNPNVSATLAAEASVAPFQSASTQAILNSVANPQEQLALLFSSSEFQRR
jgi:uncharacterized protein (DUF1800 family)